MAISEGLTWITKNVKDIRRRSFRPNAVRKMRKRAVFKNGDCNILQSRISRRRLRYLQDIFTTLVDSQWRWTLTIFAIGFLGSWLLFALIWWLIAFTHGDLEDLHLPMHQADSNWSPCVLNIHGFTSCFLFSIETQHTIGYGVRTTTEECPEAIFIMCLQSIAGMIIQAFMVGIVFAKMTRPKLRTQTLQFSKNAVICQRDGHLCLMFRVGDMRKSHIIGASIRAQLIRAKKTKEGEILSNFQTELDLNADGCDGNLFFIWPMTIVHNIDENSPFYYLSACDMLQDKFEIVVILEGTIESTGQTTQARSSYLASEVLWGHRFDPVVSYNRDRQGYEVNYSKFDNTIAIDTPLCSGAELAEFYRIQQAAEQEYRPISRQSTPAPELFFLQSPPTPKNRTPCSPISNQDEFEFDFPDVYETPLPSENNVSKGRMGPSCSVVDDNYSLVETKQRSKGRIAPIVSTVDENSLHLENNQASKGIISPSLPVGDDFSLLLEENKQTCKDRLTPSFPLIDENSLLLENLQTPNGGIPISIAVANENSLLLKNKQTSKGRLTANFPVVDEKLKRSTLKLHYDIPEEREDELEAGMSQPCLANCI